MKNTAAGFAGLFLTQVCALISASYLFRVLGPAITGVYSYSFGVVSMALPLVNFGTDQPLTREVAKDRKAAGRLLLSSLSLRAPMALVVYLLLLALFHIGVLHFKEGLPPGGRLLMYVVWLTVFTESISQAVKCVFAGLERQEISSLITSGVAITRAALTILVVYLGMRLFHMGIVAASVGACGTIALLWLVSKTATMEFKIDRRAVRGMATMGASFLAMDIFLGLMNRFDYLYLPTLSGNRDFGLYTASCRLTEALVAAGLAADTALFPIITRRCQVGEDSVRRAWDVTHKYLAIVAVACAVIFALLPEQIMLLIFGRDAAGAGAILRVIIWPAIIFFPMIPSYRILIARNGQLRLLPLFATRGVTNVALNILLAPTYGVIGSAAAKVGAEALHATLCFIFPFRSVEMFPIVRWYVKPGLAGATMAVFVYLTRARVHVLLVCLGAVVVYAAALWLLRTFSSADAEIFRSALRPGDEQPAEQIPGSHTDI
ncbi:MAG: oligosaccharide flippase family protein [Armatimonadota bacterium]|nr:oligosaccharide flippase family protein [Armatimonadota bacterium]